MLSKFLLTAAVLIIALVVLQRRRAAAHALVKPADNSSSKGSDYRLGAWLFLGLMLGAAAMLGLQRWNDANQEVTVLLHRDGSTSPVIYRVNKNELAERSFITIDGVRVTVSANERMEVVGL